MKPAVLFCSQNSVYHSLDCDVYDLSRNALTFPGHRPVVCHPPCRAWGRLRGLAKPPLGEKALAFFAVAMVRRWGGVLEHPYSSQLFGSYLPLPGTFDAWSGFSISIDQHWFGYPARKKTFLYICGVRPSDLPAHPLRFEPVTHKVGGSKRRNGSSSHLKELPRSMRSFTTRNLAEYLLEIASNCNDQEAKNHRYL